MFRNLTNEDTIRKSKQIDRTDATLAGFNAINSEELPLHDPTGEKTRKTYDFTRKYDDHTWASMQDDAGKISSPHRGSVLRFVCLPHFEFWRDFPTLWHQKWVRISSKKPLIQGD